jgi:predicted permease
VIAVSPVVAVPFSFTAWDGRPAADGQTREQASTNPTLNMEVVEPDYFAALGIRILSGRGFTAADRDGAPPVVILSESAARHYWPGMDPIGKRVRMGGTLKDVMTVVGIVPNTRYRDLRDARPSIYFPLRQSIFPFAPENLVIRTSGDPATSIASVRRAIDAIDPGIAVSSAAPLTTFLDGPLAQPRLNALLLVVFAVAALVLAAIGLFGVMATMVRQRTKELGIRLALGATANDLRQMVVSRGVLITVVGLAVGLTGSAMANRFLGTLLYDVSPSDATTLVVVSLTLLVVTLVATLVPARSSTRIDPIIVLRSEG